jgi:hypothetical protein
MRCLAIGLVPERRAYEGKTRGQRRLFALQPSEIWGGERLRVGIGRIVAGDHLEDQREVRNRAREGADVIKLARQGQNARAGDETISRFDCEHAAEGGRTDDRSVGLAAERERDHMGGHGRRRSRRRAAWRACVIVRIARGTRMEIRELRGHGLADDHRAGGAQLRDHRGVVASPAPSRER